MLEHYHDLVLTPMYAVLERDKPFAEIVEEFIEFVVQDRKALGIPPGCLQVSMRTIRDDLGDMTGQKVDALRGKTLGKYEQLIERVKQRGDFPAAIPTDVAALFFDAQNGSAMRMQKEGVPDEKIKAVLRQAFAVFL